MTDGPIGTRLRMILLLIPFVTQGLGSLPSIAADTDPVPQPLTAEQAKALALKVHAQTTAMDRLPRFYYRIKSGNADVDTMRNRDACTVEGLTEALDGPVAPADFLQWSVTFAWTEKHAYWGQGEREGPGFGEDANLHRQDRVWTKDLAFERSSTADQPAQFVFTQTAEQLWHMRLRELAYFRITPHRFWWATSNHHIDNLSPIPPEEANYRYVKTELFDEVLCDVIESPDRAVRFWVRRLTGRLHGVLVFRFSNRVEIKPFFEEERVQKIAGRSFATQLEYGKWCEGDSITAQQKMDLTRLWGELYFDSMEPNELIRFRDYREVAPKVWIPFREDRAFTHRAANPKQFKYIRLWVAVQEVRTDVDLQETVEPLLPKDGEKVQDQRFGTLLSYNYQRERTQGQLLEMVDRARQRDAANAELIKRALAPITELVGKSAPELPADGWIGTPPKLAGQPYLIHFWATWCGPCKNDLPLLKNLAAEGLPIIGMHPAGTPPEEIRTVIEDRKLGYPTYVASATADSDDRKIGGYPVIMFPYCVLVDREGQVAGHGSLGPEIIAQLRSLLRKEPSPDKQ